MKRIKTMKGSFLQLHVIDEFKVGGAQTHLVTMLESAKKRYPNITHLAVSIFNDGPVSAMLANIEIQAIVLKPSGQNIFTKSVSIFIQLSRIIAKYHPSCVEAHLTWSRIIGLPSAWLCRVPLRIGFEHGDIYYTSLPWRIANFCGQHFAHHIVVCSNALKEWVNKTHYVSNKRIEVFHNAIDLNRFNRKSTEKAFSKEEIGLKETSMLFCAVGTLGRGVDKRVDVIIKAIAEGRSKHYDLALVVCGDGNQRHDLEVLVKLNIEKQVKFLGMRLDIPDILAACDAFCHAAPFEPFGIVALEALAMELPIIVPDSGGIREMVDDRITGFLYEPLSERSLAEKMTILARDPAKARAMGIAGREAAKMQFNIENYIDSLFTLYGIAAQELKHG